jgi:hypothetical protein
MWRYPIFLSAIFLSAIFLSAIFLSAIFLSAYPGTGKCWTGKYLRETGTGQLQNMENRIQFRPPH